MRKSLLTVLGFALLLLSGSASPAAPSEGKVEEKVAVSFEFPDGTTNAITLTYTSAEEAYAKHPLPNRAKMLPYMIDFWVLAAVRALDLPFKTRTVKGETIIEQIGRTASGPDGKWIYYVNGIRSPYHINTQLNDGIKTIRFVFEPNKSKVQK